MIWYTINKGYAVATEPSIATTVQIERLTRESYMALEAKCLPTLIDAGKPVNPVHAGQIIGQQFVLKLLRDGFVVGKQ